MSKRKEYGALTMGKKRKNFDVVYLVRVNRDLKEKFYEACQSAGVNASDTMRRFMVKAIRMKPEKLRMEVKGY